MWVKGQEKPTPDFGPTRLHTVHRVALQTWLQNPMINVDGKTAHECSKEEWDCQVKGTIDKDPAKRTEAQKEVVRQKRIEKKPEDEDQVERLLEFRVYTRPEYLSLIFTNNVRSEEIENISGSYCRISEFRSPKKSSGYGRAGRKL